MTSKTASKNIFSAPHNCQGPKIHKRERERERAERLYLADLFFIIIIHNTPAVLICRDLGTYNIFCVGGALYFFGDLDYLLNMFKRI